MILACPSCLTRYLISAHLFTVGPRQVRCARCGHSWHHELPKEIDAVGPPPDADLTPVPEAVMPIPPGSGLPVVQKKTVREVLRRLLSVGVPALAFILLLFLSLLFFERRWIVGKWPVAENYYEAVGLHIYRYGEGLGFQDVRSELRYEGGKMLLAVTGNIHNGAKTTLQIPNIKATAIGVDGKVVQSWQIDSPAAIVVPDADQKFESSIDAPREAVTEITLNFIEIAHDNDH